MLRFVKVRNCGQLGIEFYNEDSDGARVSKDLLQRLVKKIVRRCVDYYDETKDYIFSYRERELNSVVCPSIAAITPALMTECSLNRKPAGEDECQGRADYLMYYRKFAFLLELKHAYFAYNNVNSPRANIFDRFNDARKKLNDIRKDECRDFAIGSKDLIKIAFETIVFYEGSHDKSKKDSWKEKDFKQLFKEMMENSKLGQEANMKALWILDPRLVKPRDYDKGYYEVYPAVAFAGNISQGQTK